ncbi:MAG TPA: hypothetical protein VFZ77_21330 [Acidimicrobiales bacterium]
MTLLPATATATATGPARSAGPPSPIDAPVAGDEATIARLMADIAAGRRSAIWQLLPLAREPVRARLRGELRRLGVRYDGQDLEGLVIDAVLAIADVAAAWRPGGAPPWSWAHHRIVGVVHRWVGTFADSLDALGDGDPGGALGWLEARGAGRRPPGVCVAAVGADDDAVAEVLAALRRLGATHPAAAELDAALGELVAPRAAAVWLAMAAEAAAGNRHPAVTVGARFGMRPEAVRKTSQRVRERLAEAGAGGRFAGLAALPAVAGRRRLAA